MKALTAREIVKGLYKGKSANQKVVKYGKINTNIAYELTQNSGAYLSSVKYNIVFVKYNPEVLGFKGETHLDRYNLDYTEIMSHIENVKKAYK